MANVDKIKSVVAYLADKTTPGKVKLFKLMYFADFTAKAQLGHPITGEIYENFEMGPVPRTLWKGFKEITAACVDIVSVETGVIPEQQMRKRQGFTPTLTPEEIEILDAVIAKYGQMSGNQLRDLTHSTLPYKATPRGDAVPYGMAGYLHYQKPSESQLAAARQNATTETLLRACAQRRGQNLKATA